MDTGCASPIQEVIVGPVGTPPDAIEELRHLFDENGLDEVAVRKSAVPLTQ